MQLLAIVSMLLDHAGMVLYPDNTIWRIAGRLALPLYVYGLVIGWDRTRDKKRYVGRLVIIGAAAQVPFMVLVGNRINVIGTFLVILAVFWIVDRFKSLSFTFISIIFSAIVLEVIPFDYGAYALLLALSYRYLTGFNLIIAHTLINFLAVIYHGWLIQVFSIISTLLIIYAANLLAWMGRLKIPRALWLSFYPAHLLILAVYILDPLKL